MSKVGHRLTGALGVIQHVVRRGPAGPWSLSALAASGSLAIASTVLAAGPDSVRVPPVAVTVQSAPSLPPEAKALEAASAAALFDRDTVTQHLAYEVSSVEAKLERATDVQAIKLYGAAPYLLSVQAQGEAGSAWRDVPGLQDIDLSKLPERWSTVAASQSVSASSLRFVLKPNGSASGKASGLKGIEIWGGAGQAEMADPRGFNAVMRSATSGARSGGAAALPSGLRRFAAKLAAGTIGAAQGETDDASDNRFAVAIDRDPAQFRRAHLEYEVQGKAHWLGVARDINGRARLGGTDLPGNDRAWSRQVEPIDPQWLHAGDNAVTFAASGTEPYRVRNIALVGELDIGQNHGASASASPAVEGHAAQAVIDGSFTTGWTPHPAHSAAASDVQLTLDFERPTQVDALMVYVKGRLRGEAAVELRRSGLWSASGAKLEGTKLVTGWNTVKLAGQASADAMRLSFTGGQGSTAELMEVAVSGSVVGANWDPARVSVSYPDAGQFYGRAAYLRGFVQPLDNGSGEAQLFIGGQLVSLTDGAFDYRITKDEVANSGQTDSEPWQVELRALYPDGKAASTIVKLNRYHSALEGAQAGSQAMARANMRAGQGGKLAHGGAVLDVGAGALALDTQLSITELKLEQLARLDAGMVNVTQGLRRGYRFLPHGSKFKQKVRVTLPYDPALIPPGLSEEDIRTWYFDEQRGRWQMLERTAIDTQAKTITSLSDHFTDMINATVTVPEHPQALSYNPTQIKDIKAADPGAGINLIEPPRANNMGDARLAYPIEVPPGRQGMQPRLAVQYASGGGNGWLGQGWDISLPAVSIDTRWGVPRYGRAEDGSDSGLETESYLLDGEALAPLAHRGAPVPRSAEKTFRPRVEGRFAEITRHGDHPKNYWWEVRDKDGSRRFYGGRPGTGQERAAVLADAESNVFRWALVQHRDSNGNTVNYEYATVADKGVGSGAQDGGEPGRQLYAKRIRYTGFGNDAGAYEVEFVRDRELGEARRGDVQIDARGGFKAVTADLLRRIDVRFKGELVRRYALEYREGAFGKTLLAALAQYGTDGTTEFNRHQFAYHDDARAEGGQYRGFAASQTWNTEAEADHYRLLGKDLRPSMIGGSKSTSRGYHLYVGMGYGGNVTSKTETAGFKVGGSTTESETLTALVDVDGDGLPDKVFKGKDGGTFYRRNLAHEGGTFGGRTSLGLPGIGSEKNHSKTLGAEVYFVAPVMYDKNTAESVSSAYFSDVNGDGVTDFIDRGTVLFGRVGADGAVSYTPDSNDTPVPIGAGAIATAELLADAAERQAENARDFPLVDSLRRWVAPWDGTVEVTGAVRLLQDTSPERARYVDRLGRDMADGVRVAIQHEGAEKWSARIAANQYEPVQPAGVNAIAVRRGERLYFRVQSVQDGAYDQVAWAPVVRYVGADAQRRDVNGLPVYAYSAAGDFVVGSQPGAGTATAPLRGTIRFEGRFEKTAATTDHVNLVLLQNGSEVLRRNFDAAQTAALNLNESLRVNKLDTLEWRVLVDSPIDASKLAFAPKAYYTEAEGVSEVRDPDTGENLLVLPLGYSLDVYPANRLTAPQAAYVAPSDGTLSVDLAVQINGLAARERTEGVFTIKRTGELLAKQALVLVGPSPAGGSARVDHTVRVPVRAGDTLYFDVSSRDARWLSNVGTLTLNLTPDSPSQSGAALPVALHVPSTDNLFQRGYRGWSAAGLKDAVDPASVAPGASGGPRGLYAEQAFPQSLLVINQPPSSDPTEEQAIAWAQNQSAYPYAADAARARQSGPDEFTWVDGTRASASRLGRDDIVVIGGEAFAGARAVDRVSRSKSDSVGVYLSGSKGTTEGRLDFQDFNGDRFPDIVSSASVQFSDARGGLEPGVRLRGADTRTRTGKNTSFGGSIQGAGSAAVTIARALGKSAPDGGGSGQPSKQGSDMPEIGLDGSLGLGTSDGTSELIDVNGDGLPDRVYDNGRVAFNLGYRFGAAEAWSDGDESLNRGKSVNAGASFGFNLNYYSIGGGANLNISDSTGDDTYADVNGDGLPDKVNRADGGLLVRLNRGARFDAEAVRWPSPLEGVARDKSLSMGLGGYATFGFTFWGAYKVVFNPGANASKSIGRPELALRDIDGDGYADHVRSSSDAELDVASNPIARTNLLKQVKRPLGAAIDIDYQRVGNTYELPQPRWVMSRVSVHDGQSGDGPDTQLTTYRYEGGRYERFERDFYGFASVVEEDRDTAANDALYRSTTRSYATGNYYLKGLQTGEVLADAAGRPYLSNEQTYVLRDEQSGAEPADGASATAVLFPQLVKTEARQHEGSTSGAKTRVTTHAYDRFGNVTRFADSGDDAGSADDVSAAITYSAEQPACRANGLTGTALAISVSDRANQSLRRRDAEIDCTTGDLRQVRQYLASGAAATTDLTYDQYGNLARVTGPANARGQRYELAYAYDAEVATHVREVRDSFGYVSTASHDLRFGQATETRDLNAQRITTALDGFGRVATITSPYQQSENAALNQKAGQATITFSYHPEAAVPYARTLHLDLERTDPIETQLYTDGLKRVLQTKQDASLHAGANQSPREAMTISGRVRYDAFGRSVASWHPTWEPKGAHQTGNAAFAPAFDTSAPPASTTYDLLDRPLLVTAPDGTQTRVAYDLAPDPEGQRQQRTVSTDALLNSKTTWRDGLGRITAVQEHAGVQHEAPQPLVTRYRYDPLGQITEVIDARGHRTRAGYDLLGRRTELDNPDAGKTQSKFDLASNLVEKVTAKLAQAGQAIAYSYDFNRLAGIRYPNEANGRRQDVAYEYGAPGAPYGQAGRVTKVSSAAGSEERRYGPLGEIVHEKKSVVTHQTPQTPEVYETASRYDTWGRIRELSYPDGEVLTHRYDSGGQLQSIQGKRSGHAGNSTTNSAATVDYLQRLDYDHFGQRVYQRLGNGVETAWSYEPKMRRLCALETAPRGNALSRSTACPSPRSPEQFASSAATSHAYQALAYGYDPVGNLLAIDNQIAVPHAGANADIQLGPVLQRYGYDRLYRLTQAQGHYRHAPAKSEQYTLTLAYDGIHNLTRKNQRHWHDQPNAQRDERKTSYDWSYDYRGNKPHAPTHIGDRTYSYDANGNQTGWTDDHNGTRRSLVWDDDNRIASVSDGGGKQADPPEAKGRTQTYVYDDEGQRVIKRGAQGETVYVNPWFTVRNGQIGSKHVYAGSTRIATALVMGQGAGTASTSAVYSASAAEGTPGNRTDLPPGLQNNQGLANRSGNSQGQNTVRNPWLQSLGANAGTFTYYYHGDHLGSTGLVTDANGKPYEHIQYFAFGETWVQDASNTQRTPYLFTGKELDEETGLYYFGARYYDPRTSVWQSVDRILDQYLDGGPQGGVYRSASLALYTYTYNNPIIYNDPDGNVGLLGAAIGAVAGVVIQGGIDLYRGELSSAGAYAGAALGGAVVGATAGLGTGFVGGAVAVGSGAAGGATATVTQAAVDGKAVTTVEIAKSAAYGAAGGAAGQAAGKLVKYGADQLSNGAKGSVGEVVTQIKYAAQGYASEGKAVVQTGARTATGKAQAAHYDHAMKNLVTGKRLTVESKFNTSRLTPNQIKAQGNVTTPGGLIIDRTTSDQLGKAANAATRGAAVGASE